MFCTRCGAPMQSDLAACHACGRRLGDPTGGIAQSRLDRHLNTLSILWMVLGGLFLIPAAGLMIFGRAAHFVVRGNEPFAPIFPLLLYIAGSTFLILAAGGVCVGLGLQQHLLWARTAALVLGILALFHPPFGTALGIYTLWVLLADENGDTYRYLASGD